MFHDYSREQKLWLWALFLTALIGISLGYRNHADFSSFSAWFEGFMRWVSYFTELTNTIVVIMSAVLLFGRSRWGKFFHSPSVQSAVCLYIAFVGIGYWFILGGSDGYNNTLDFIRDNSYHTLSPIIGVIFWIRGVPKGSLRWIDPVKWLSYPTAYLVYWLFRGPIVGSYPYFFIDVDAMGYGGVARWSGILIVGLLFLGSIMWGVDQMMGKRHV